MYVVLWAMQYLQWTVFVPSLLQCTAYLFPPKITDCLQQQPNLWTLTVHFIQYTDKTTYSLNTEYKTLHIIWVRWAVRTYFPSIFNRPWCSRDCSTHTFVIKWLIFKTSLQLNRKSKRAAILRDLSHIMWYVSCFAWHMSCVASHFLNCPEQL